MTATVPGFCNFCQQPVRIPLQDMALEELDVEGRQDDRPDVFMLNAVCPNGHGTVTLVREGVAYRLRKLGVRSIADEITDFLADRKTDIL